MTEVLDQLKAALAGRCVLERERGRGGMAAVYVARAELERMSVREDLSALVGSIGADSIHHPVRGCPDRDSEFAPDTRELTRPSGAEC